MVAGIAILANFVHPTLAPILILHQDKRYTLTPATEEAIDKVEQNHLHQSFA